MEKFGLTKLQYLIFKKAYKENFQSRIGFDMNYNPKKLSVAEIEKTFEQKANFVKKTCEKSDNFLKTKFKKNNPITDTQLENFKEEYPKVYQKLALIKMDPKKEVDGKVLLNLISSFNIIQATVD